jgi:hypothetical protein
MTLMVLQVSTPWQSTLPSEECLSMALDCLGRKGYNNSRDRMVLESEVSLVAIQNSANGMLMTRRERHLRFAELHVRGTEGSTTSNRVRGIH